MKINDMKKILTILTMFITSAFFAQVDKRMVLIPNYPTNYEIRPNNNLVNITEMTPYRTGDIFVIGNFNKVNIIRPMINIPKTTVNNNNAEYVKTTQFNPNKSLQEILRDDKK